MGLNHQAASLSCALGEAHFLNRTLLLPDAICLSGLHTERWRAAGQPAGEVCVPLGELWDVGLLSQLVPLMLVPHNLTHAMRGAARRPGGAASRVARVGPSWPSARVRASYPCEQAAPAQPRFVLVRRQVDVRRAAPRTVRARPSARLAPRAAPHPRRRASGSSSARVGSLTFAAWQRASTSC